MPDQFSFEYYVNVVCSFQDADYDALIESREHPSCTCGKNGNYQHNAKCPAIRIYFARRDAKENALLNKHI